MQLEVGNGEVGDRTKGVPLVAGPAAEVENHGPARPQHLVGNPDEPTFQNVALPTESNPPHPNSGTIHSSGVSRKAPLTRSSS